MRTVARAATYARTERAALRKTEQNVRASWRSLGRKPLLRIRALSAEKKSRTYRGMHEWFVDYETLT